MRKTLGALFLSLTATVLLTSCPTDSEGDSAVQFTQAYTFTNENEPAPGVEVNDLHIIFKNPDIKVLGLGPFDRSEAVDTGTGNDRHTEVDLATNDSVASGGKAKVSFQSEETADFAIKTWWWTDTGDRVGPENEGDPKALWVE